MLGRAREAGVECVCTIASSLEDARDAIALAGAQSRPRVAATAGIHPHEADSCSPEALGGLEDLASSSDAVVAIGETGLDFHYEHSPRAAQVDAFRGQLGVAERLGLPIVVHVRDASAEVAEIVREHAGRVIGVLHCFTGSTELLRSGLGSGWYVSFSGIVTFSSYRDAQHIIEVPEERLLVETDSPYLAPVPVRGRRNEPAFVAHVVRRIAEVRGRSPEEIAELTYQNAARFYGVGS